MAVTTIIFVSTLMFSIIDASSDIKFIKSEYKVDPAERRDNDAGYNIVEYTNVTFTHAESPVWDDETQTFYWVDVLAQDVHALYFIDGGGFLDMKHRIRHIDQGEVNIVIPIKGSRKLLVAVDNALYVLDWDVPGHKGLRHVATFDQGSPDNILNEGKADALGRFWGGTKGPQNGDVVEKDFGTFNSVEAPKFHPEIQLKPVTISNGLAWSLNNSILYYIDSGTRRVDAFDFDLVRGRLSNRRKILDLKDYDIDAKVIPDGMTIDKDGFLWVALNFGGSVIRVNPDQSGAVVTTFKLPTSEPTSLTWGGPDLNWLFITTSKRNLDARRLNLERLAGSVFILHNTTTSGVPGHKFSFPNVDVY